MNTNLTYEERKKLIDEAWKKEKAKKRMKLFGNAFLIGFLATTSTYFIANKLINKNVPLKEKIEHIDSPKIQNESLVVKTDATIVEDYELLEKSLKNARPMKPTFTNYYSSDSLTSKILDYMEQQNKCSELTFEDDAQIIEVKKVMGDGATGIRYTLKPKENLNHPDLLNRNMIVLTDYQRDGSIDSGLEYVVENSSRKKIYFISETAIKWSNLARDMGLSNLDKAEQYQNLGLDIKEKILKLIYKN
ncbi:MAG: hypothetical protein AB7V77_04715 [Candidatus Woesearchaeota archaeon]